MRLKVKYLANFAATFTLSAADNKITNACSLVKKN